MRQLWDRLRAWWGRLWHRPPHGITQPALYRAAFVADDQFVPKRLPPGIVYIVGLRGNEWLAVLACPCGCGEALPLNLLQDEMPHWTWRVGADGSVTLSPSVWRKVRCRSHFILRDGRVHWCDT